MKRNQLCQIFLFIYGSFRYVANHSDNIAPKTSKRWNGKIAKVWGGNLLWRNIKTFVWKGDQKHGTPAPEFRTEIWTQNLDRHVWPLICFNRISYWKKCRKIRPNYPLNYDKSKQEFTLNRVQFVRLSPTVGLILNLCRLRALNGAHNLGQCKANMSWRIQQLQMRVWDCRAVRPSGSQPRITAFIWTGMCRHRCCPKLGCTC
jgi:hypothetical protein